MRKNSDSHDYMNYINYFKREQKNISNEINELNNKFKKMKYDYNKLFLKYEQQNIYIQTFINRQNNKK